MLRSTERDHRLGNPLSSQGMVPQRFQATADKGRLRCLRKRTVRTTTGNTPDRMKGRTHSKLVSMCACAMGHSRTGLLPGCWPGRFLLPGTMFRANRNGTITISFCTIVFQVMKRNRQHVETVSPVRQWPARSATGKIKKMSSTTCCFRWKDLTLGNLSVSTVTI